MRRKLTLTATFLLLISLAGMATIQAASSYADPQFETQWKQGEAITPNFWGPLANAKDGQQEEYKDVPGGKRTVQYFDKGRMELTNGKVTNGLLATEIIKGKIQTGDNTFQDQAPPNISIAGDASNPAPTYAGLATKGAALLQDAASKPGVPVTTVIGSDGAVSTTDTAVPDPAMQIGAYDDVTKHNVAAGFVDYRAKAGLPTIGYAISEPFRANVKVGGTPKDVMVQVFERRVLTYTASNPDAFKVEMGNIGQHYYQWRYANGTPTGTAGGGQAIIVLNGLVALAIPDTWQVDSTPITAGPPRSTIIGPGPNQRLVIQVDDQSNPPATLDDTLAPYVTAAHTKLVTGTITDEATFSGKIGGEPAKAYQISGTRQDNSPVSTFIVVVIHKDKIFTFIVLADASPMPNDGDIQAILGTVTFQT
jgi:hypothetical protein